jgi:predicted flavoprotein YhiN
MLQAFGGPELCAWAHRLGISTFVGSSGRVFPADMKAAPLLRAGLSRLRGAGVQFHMRHRWLGMGSEGAMRFVTPQGEVTITPRTTVLALGGASWARLGSDGRWVPLLSGYGVDISPLQPANCGFDVLRQHVDISTASTETRRAFLQELMGQKTASPPSALMGWTPHFANRFAGQPFKSVALHFTDHQGQIFHKKGEFVATAAGVEGSLIYAVSHLLRDTIAAQGHATFTLDLLPDYSTEKVLAELRHPRGSRSLSSHLKSRLGIDGIKASLLHEQLSPEIIADHAALASAIKAVPITAITPRPINEAISTAGGVTAAALTDQLMLRKLPGVFCAGEMLDWEAPTGGYLLTACWATGLRAGQGALAYLAAVPAGSG